MKRGGRGEGEDGQGKRKEREEREEGKRGTKQKHTRQNVLLLGHTLFVGEQKEQGSKGPGNKEWRAGRNGAEVNKGLGECMEEEVQSNQ